VTFLPTLPDRDARLLEAVDATMEAAARRCGAFLACRAGCTECCIGPFPISALDAERLSRGLAHLSKRDPARADAVRERAARSAALVLPGLPASLGGAEPGGEAEEEAFLERHATLPCPALEPSSGLCDLYAHRPIACRTYGPPMRIGGEDLAPCRLCFVGAPEEEVAARRAELDVAADEAPLEDAALEAGFAGPTLVALALFRP
jgi:Fe-S-cluster containining protein